VIFTIEFNNEEAIERGSKTRLSSTKLL